MMSKPLKTLARPLAILDARLLDPASKRDERGEGGGHGSSDTTTAAFGPTFRPAFQADFHARASPGIRTIRTVRQR